MGDFVDRLFRHELEHPRSILCFYSAWPIGWIVIAIAVLDLTMGNPMFGAMEILVALALLTIPAVFKQEHQFSPLRVLFAMLLIFTYSAFLLARAPHPIGLIWLPLYPVFTYILLGARLGHALVALMWLLLIVSLPFSQIELNTSLMLIAAMLMSTIVANKYEWALAIYHARLSHLAEKDPVTDIPNRRAMLALLDSIAFSTRPISVLMIDVDHFKAINDQHGHAAGDRALRMVAKVIEGQLRKEQRIGRWGGDEFLVTLPDVDPNLAQDIAERIHARTRLVDCPPLSIGVASRQVGEETSHLVHRADQALYSAKHQGRDRIEVAE